MEDPLILFKSFPHSDKQEKQACIMFWYHLLWCLLLDQDHCVKSVQIWIFFWSVFSSIWTEYRKIWTRNTSVFGHFSLWNLLRLSKFTQRWPYSYLRQKNNSKLTRHIDVWFAFSFGEEVTIKQY